MVNFLSADTPEGFEDLAPFLLEVEEEMKTEEIDEKMYDKKYKRYWKIYQLHNKRNRYLFSLIKNKEMSRELYNFLSENNFLDKALIGFWKKSGYEKLCCLRCLQKEGKFDTVCICRVPRSKIESEFECEHCGCKGCCG